MRNLSTKIDDSVDDVFRRAAAEKYGMKRGNMTKAVEEALSDFAKKVESSSKGRGK